VPRTWPATQAGDFTVIVLPDPQNYAVSYPAYGQAQTRWILHRENALGIRMVLGEGDNVNDDGVTAQWVGARTIVDLLQQKMPNLIAAGNHDYLNQNPATRDLTSFNTYYPSTRYTDAPWFNGELANAGLSENGYMTLTSGGETFLFMWLEFAPQAATITWAAGILAANTDKLAIVLTHSYLNVDNTYTVEGQALWDDLIKLHDNIICVLAGHIATPADGAGYRVDNSDGGQPVHQIQSDYQDMANGGNGYLRVMRFVPSARRIYIETYSPYLATWLTDGENEFDVVY